MCAATSCVSLSAHLICFRMPRTGAVDDSLTQPAGKLAGAGASSVSILLSLVSGSALQGHAL